MRASSFFTAREDAFDGTDDDAKPMEDFVGFRHYLSGLGVDVPGDSNRRTGGAAISVRGDALYCRRDCALRVDARKGYAFACSARVGSHIVAGGADLRDGLRIGLLGGAARAFRDCGR